MLSSFSSFKRSFAKYYTTTHEYIDINGNEGKVGLSSYAAHHLGDIVFADVQNGKQVKAGDELGDLESVKATSPIISPMAGTVIEVNGKVAEDPSIVNKSPELNGWIAKLSLEDPSNVGSLMDEKAYKDFLSNSH